MLDVVLQVVAAQPVHEHVQALPVGVEPGHDLVELVGTEGQLATPARVRADHALVHAADADAEPAAGFLGQRTRLVHGGSVEIQVRVVGGVEVDGSAGHPWIVRRGHNRRMHTTRRTFAALAALLVSCAGFAFDLQGHRGARGLAPENTLPAFERALELGVDTLELDIGVTADGAVVVLHDPYLNPLITRDAAGQWLAGTRGPLVRSLTLAQLQAHDVGRIQPGSPYARTFETQQGRDGVRVPTLAQVFDLVKARGAANVRFNIETKLHPGQPDDTLAPDAMVQALLKVVRDAGMLPRTTVQSFDWRTLQIAQKLEPGIRTAYLTVQTANSDNVRDGDWMAGLRVADHGGSVPRLVKAAGGAVWSPNQGSLTEPLVKEAQALGLQVIPWTVNDPAFMERFIGWGVDGLITDYPDRAREVMRKRGMALPVSRP